MNLDVNTLFLVTIYVEVILGLLLLLAWMKSTELRHKNASMLDALTGIANRRAFLHEASELARRQLDNPRPVAVLLLDLDHFKSINDRFGHAIGDRVLQVFAQTATANLRPTDLVGRIGGEEFAVILHDAGSERALGLAERIRFGFADAARYVDGELLGATVSIGLIVNHDGLLDLTPLLAQADQALYRAKARGRNRVEVAGQSSSVAHLSVQSAA